MQVRLGEGANRVGHSFKSVTTGGRERAFQIEQVQRVCVAGKDFGGRGVAVEVGQQGNQSAYDWRVGVGTEATAAFSQFAD